MHGLLIIDKPQGISSHDVVRRVRRALKTRKVGHGGTLDPMATGLLPVALGEGTRILQFLLEGDKGYRATLKLGEITDTQDAEGTVVEARPVEAFSREAIEAACLELVGDISQVPPMYSAIKQNGVPLYRLARQGIEVERESRQVHIERFSVLDVDLPYVTVEVECSKGTYVRTLCHDLGLLLGAGAHLTALRRTRSGGFTETDSVTLEELEKDPKSVLPGKLFSLVGALRGYPALEVAQDAAGRLMNGIPPALPSVTGADGCREGERVLLMDAGVLLAVARFDTSRTREKRGDFELLRVFHRPGE